MNPLKRAREARGLSQRRLAAQARLSYKSIQLLESGHHDPQLSTIAAVAEALGYPPASIARRFDDLFQSPPDSVRCMSERIVIDGENSWKLWLFNFVDAFRCTRDAQYIAAPPVDATPPHIRALLTSTVDALCDETGLPLPWWSAGIAPLADPWFVAGIESLKAIAIVEAPIHFRKRNIFVLNNFLERA